VLKKSVNFPKYVLAPPLLFKVDETLDYNSFTEESSMPTFELGVVVVVILAAGLATVLATV
jgi:hypothetical protein